MVDNIIIVVFMIIVWTVGFFKSRHINNMREYSIAHKNYALPVMVATLTATVIGSGSTLGFISSVFTSGIVYILISFGNPLSRFVVAQLLVSKIEKFSDCISIGDIMEKYFGKYARIVTGICGALYCAANVGGQISAIGFVVQYFLEIPYFFGVLIGCGTVIIYSTMGGVKAVTATDVLQFAVLIIAIPMVCNVGLNVVGGYGSLLDSIPKSLLALPSGPGPILNSLFLFLAFLLPFMDPPYTQRLLMAKDVNQVRNILRASALVEAPFFICIGLIGLIAAAINPEQEANLAFPYLVNTILPIGLRGIAVAGLLSVVMSSADSYLNAAGITLVHDTIKPLYNKDLSDQSELKLTQILTFVLGTFATVVALSLSSIMNIMLFSFNFWCPIVVVPFYAILLGLKNLSPKCFYAGALAGIFVFFIWYIFIEPLVGISGLIPSMLANAIAFTVAYYLKPLAKEQIA
jgi:solute:Na+ symporter, SSS family